MERKLKTFTILILFSYINSCGYSSNATPEEEVGPGPTSLEQAPNINIQISNLDRLYIHDDINTAHMHDELFALNGYLMIGANRNFFECLTKEEFEALDLSKLTPELQALDKDGNSWNNDVLLMVCPTDMNLTITSWGGYSNPNYMIGVATATETTRIEIDVDSLLSGVQSNGNYSLIEDFDLLEPHRTAYETNAGLVDDDQGSTYMILACQRHFYEHLLMVDERNTCGGNGRMCLQAPTEFAPNLLNLCRDYNLNNNPTTVNLSEQIALNHSFQVDVKFDALGEHIVQRKHFDNFMLLLGGSIFNLGQENDNDDEAESPSDPSNDDEEEVLPQTPTIDPTKLIRLNESGSTPKKRAGRAEAF